MYIKDGQRLAFSFGLFAVAGFCFAKAIEEHYKIETPKIPLYSVIDDLAENKATRAQYINAVYRHGMVTNN